MMTETRQNSWIKMGLATLAAVALLAVALPLLAALSIAARVLIPFALVAAVVVALMVPSLREQIAFGDEGEESYKGLRVPQGALLHTAHTWARARGRALVAGIDDLMARVVGPPDAVELPAVGATVAAGQPLMTLRRGERTVVARSPVTGRVVATNKRLAADPALAGRSPYRGGWAVRIEPTERDTATSTLMRGAGATRWFTQEVDRLMATLAGPVAARHVMQDGGAVVEELHDAIDDDTFRTIRDTFFA